MKVLVALGALAFVVACESADVAAEPAWGKQACGECSMLVSEPRFAAQLVTTSGDRLFFDDPGCMATWVTQHVGKARQQWVRGADGQWLGVATARFSSGAHTPMDYGFEVADRGELDWPKVIERVRSRVAERGTP